MREKIIFFMISFFLVFGIGYWLWNSSGLLSPKNYTDLAVEFHGMIFDIILFGIVLTIYEWAIDRRDRIRRHKEEIEDYLGWAEKEATHRIVGNIKRLNKLGITNILLHRAHLKEANLHKANLQKANLELANLERARLMDTNLEGANLARANLQGAKAFIHQKEEYAKVLSEAQLNSIEWLSAQLP